MQDSTLNFIYFLAVIGGIWFVMFLSKLLWTIIKFILPSKNYQERYGRGSWAVITGGSDGIGLGFAQQLAKLGFNICIVARNQNKIDTAFNSLRRLNQDIETKSIIADFTDCQKQGFFRRIYQQLQGKDISFLVNNVGISNIGYLHQIPTQRIYHEININCVPMTIMSQLLIPNMLKRQKRSAIVNISSLAGSNPIPYISTYSATKAYNDFFSQSIEMQYYHKIDILSVKPLYVQSNLSKLKKSCTVASKNQCASASLNALGIDYVTNGYYMHRMMAYITQCIPKAVIRCMSQSQSRKIMEKQKMQN